MSRSLYEYLLEIRSALRIWIVRNQSEQPCQYSQNPNQRPIKNPSKQTGLMMPNKGYDGWRDSNPTRCSNTTWKYDEHRNRKLLPESGQGIINQDTGKPRGVLNDTQNT